MMGFEEQWDNDGFLSNCSMQDAKHFYEAGAASRQAEIDCLKVELDAANERAMMLLNHKNKMVDKLQGEVDELQKRIDEALNFYNIAKSDVNIGMMQMSIYLKGKEND